MIKRISTLLGLTALAAVLLSAGAAPAFAGSAAIARQPVNPAQAGPARPGVATFQGRTIDLSVSWEGARVCTVISASDVRCFASADEADTALAASSAAVFSTWHGCPDNYLCLYENPNWNGRRLQFQQDYWQSLVPYGFDGRTSSWTNNQNNLGCTDTGILGNGAGDNRTLSDCSASASLGSYDNVATDVHG
jgi:hypothetical protein